MFKKIWFQIHWFIGITAGSLLMLVGVTGAMLSFSDEIIEALNPGVMSVARRPAAPLDAQQLITQIQTVYPDRPLLAATLTADAAGSPRLHAARINFAAPPGVRRGELRYADPYSGELLPPLRAQPFFQWIEFLHRFLLLPAATGKPIIGSAAMCLLLLALSGLYLRWPRQALQWRAWFKLDFGLQGRSFLWHLHSMLGTWALLTYLVFAVTGMYWSFDWVKNGLNRLAGGTPAARVAQAKNPLRPKRGGETDAASAREILPAAQLARVWRGFAGAVSAYGSVTVRLPQHAGEPVQISYLDLDAPHERARNRMRIDPATGAIGDYVRYNDKSAAGRLVDSVYPLHMGTYFGLPGRIVMTIAALGLPLFGVTGWMLYLDRRRKKHAIARERIAISAASGAPVDDSVLIVFATQSGYAEQIALRTAAALHAAGVAVNVRSISRLGLEQLRHFRRALFVVSSFGDGDPPDSARPFMRQLMHQSGAALAHLHYGVLALGDRRYRNFCGYGHALDRRLQSRGARNRFAVVEVDNADPVALAQWQRPLADFCGVADIGMPIGATAAASPATAAAHYESWRLTERVHLNPGSTGEPIFHLALTPPEPGRQWRSGALVEILPRQTPQQVLHTLQETHMDGAAPVWFDGAQCTLAEALACTVLPTSGGPPPDAQSWVDSLQRLTPRRYSAASIAADQTLQLLVRQSTREGRLGLASGWLTAHAALGGAIDCRLLDNPGFALSLENAPAIFIGNGSGMAGLRSHLRARAPNRDGRRRNWLLLGERNRAHDFHYRDEIEQWQRDGVLARVDLAFSRDGSERIYVQDKLRQACASVREWVADGAVIYVCGSLEGMAAGVDATLGEILGADGLEQLIAAGRYRRDVY